MKVEALYNGAEKEDTLRANSSKNHLSPILPSVSTAKKEGPKVIESGGRSPSVRRVLFCEEGKWKQKLRVDQCFVPFGMNT